MRPSWIHLAVSVALLALVVSTLAVVVVMDGKERGSEHPPHLAEAEIDPAEELERLHDGGPSGEGATGEPLPAGSLTGEGVAVGVIDVTAFDGDDPRIADRVVTTRTFEAGDHRERQRPDGHGTAAAAVVARTAPDASLYLATVDGSSGFEDAMAWMREKDVDVVVAPVSFYGTPTDGSDPAARAADRAVQDGTVVVAPTGNLGQRTWSGRFLPDGEGAHRFAEDTRNALVGEARTIQLWLTTPGEPDVEAFAVELYREDDPADELVARSEPFGGDPHPNQRLVTSVDPDASYYVVVRGPTGATGTPLRLASPTHRFVASERAGSLTSPGTAPGVLTVGAFDDRLDRVEPYSAAGPIADDRRGTDLVAPDGVETGAGGFVGTSVSAAYTGGVVALTLEADPDLEPEDVHQTLTSTAADVPAHDTDPVAGHGRIDPVAAVAHVANASVETGDRDRNPTDHVGRPVVVQQSGHGADVRPSHGTPSARPSPPRARSPTCR